MKLQFEYEVRVAKNISEENEKIFGKPGTILLLKKILGENEAMLYLSNKLYLCLSKEINSVEDINDFIGQPIFENQFGMRPRQRTVFLNPSRVSENDKFTCTTQNSEYIIKASNIDEESLAALNKILMSWKEWGGYVSIKWTEEGRNES